MIANTVSHVSNAANDNDANLSSLGVLLAHNVLPRIYEAMEIDLTYQFSVFASALEYLGQYTDFRLDRQPSQTEHSLKYQFSFATDPDAFLDIEIKSNSVLIESSLDCEILGNWGRGERISARADLYQFNTARTAFEHIKEFIEDNDPSYSSDTVNHVADVRDRLDFALH